MNGIAKLTEFTFEHAVRALAGVLPAGAAADRGLSAYFRSQPKLGSADRGVIAETVYAVLRNRRSLAASVGCEYPRELALAALVRVRGMNLRQLEQVLRSGEADLVARVKAFSLDTASAAVRHDLPDWLWARLVEGRGEDGARALARALQGSAPLDLRVNTVRSTRGEVLRRLAAEGIDAQATPLSPLGIRVTGKPALQRHLLFLDGTIEVQDEGSQLVAELLEPRRGEMVADFCAGAGGKTLALGALMRSTGRLYAFDVSAARLARLKPRLARSGLSNVHPVRIESVNDIRVKRLAGKFDRVLVDAPCTGLGTLRRNPELKWRQLENDVTQLAARQTTILEAAARLVKPGGRLVYATCSLLAEENQAVLARFLEGHAEFAVRDACEVLAGRGIRLASGAAPALELLPHVHGTDGFFAAVLERRS